MDQEASAPYPPAALLTAAGLYAIGAATGIGFYGMVLLLAALFVALSLWYFLNTRWHLFPSYLNFAHSDIGSSTCRTTRTSPCSSWS